MPVVDDGDVGGDQWLLEDPSQQDHLGHRQCDDAHHEREHGAHREALVVEGFHERQHASGVGVQRDAEPDGDDDAPQTR